MTVITCSFYGKIEKKKKTLPASKFYLKYVQGIYLISSIALCVEASFHTHLLYIKQTKIFWFYLQVLNLCLQMWKTDTPTFESKGKYVNNNQMLFKLFPFCLKMSLWHFLKYLLQFGSMRILQYICQAKTMQNKAIFCLSIKRPLIVKVMSSYGFMCKVFHILIVLLVILFVTNTLVEVLQFVYVFHLSSSLVTLYIICFLL